MTLVWSLTKHNTVFLLVQASLFLSYFVSKLVFLSSKKNTTQSTIASWGPWPSSVAGTFDTLEDMVCKIIDLDLSAPHCKVKVLGVIQDAWTPTDGQSLRRHSRRVNPLGIPTIFQLVCHAFLSITFAFSGYSRSVEARNCRSDRRETETPMGQKGKTENRIGYQIRKPVGIFRENRKPNAEKRKIRKPQWTPKPKDQSFLA